MIESDASRTGWGAVCQGSRMGGPRPWSRAEQRWYINCLEALAAFLAVKCFVRDKRGQTVLLRMDNVTVVTYVNKLGGTVSPTMNRIVKDLWMWCMRKDITLIAGDPKFGGRRGVLSNEGQIRLDAEPQNF